MTEQQLYDTLEKCGRTGYIIVRMRIGYEWDNKWEYLNEILEYNPNSGDSHADFIWENDWDEGQQRVEILDYIFVDDLWSPICPLSQPEIIRCAGCHYYADGHCDMHNMGVSPDDYCSYAVGKYKIE